MTEVPDKCDWCRKTLGRTWISKSGLFFCLQEYSPDEGRCSTRSTVIIDRWRTVIAAAKEIDETIPGIDPEETPEFARAATRLEFALEDLFKDIE